MCHCVKYKCSPLDHKTQENSENLKSGLLAEHFFLSKDITMDQDSLIGKLEC